MDDEKFYEKLVAELNSVNSGISDAAPRVGMFGVLQRFMDIVKKVAANTDMSTVSREQFLAMVGKAFDTVVAPLLSAMGPWSVIAVPALKIALMAAAGRFYDNRIAPKPVPTV